jgi:lipopolysaccharide export LptBFGC system permease protein LptF
MNDTPRSAVTRWASRRWTFWIGIAASSLWLVGALLLMLVDLAWSLAFVLYALGSLCFAAATSLGSSYRRREIALVFCGVLLTLTGFILMTLRFMGRF